MDHGLVFLLHSHLLIRTTMKSVQLHTAFLCVASRGELVMALWKSRVEHVFKKVGIYLTEPLIQEKFVNI